MKHRVHLLFFGFLSLIITNYLHSQVTITFQGTETGDPWSYTTSGASATAQNEALSAQNKTSGVRSLVAGGNTGGGNCFAGGTGNGPSTPRFFAFSDVDISQSNEFTRTLTLNWGNRFPACNGTGWDSGENLTFTAYHDGAAQPTVTLANGSGNAQFSIQTHQHTHSIPPCVNTFRFTISVTTNRSDELLFVDDVILTAPQLNSSTAQPSPIAGNITVCSGTSEIYSVTNVPSTNYTWSGLPAGAQFTDPNGTNASSNMTVDWGTATAGVYTLTVTPSNACGGTGTAQTLDVTVLEQPSVTISPTGPQTICSGASLLITATGSSGTYTWQDASVGPDFNASVAGEYYVTVSNSCGQQNSDTVTLTVNTAPNVSISGNTFFCPGDSVLLTASGGANYTWSNGESGNSIYVDVPGTYTASASNGCGSSTSPDLVVSMGTLPTAQISGNLFYCEGDSVLLTASGGDTYLWSTGNAGSTLYVSQPGTYFVTATNQCGDVQSANVNISEVALPAPQISGTLSFCPGDSTLLTAGGGANYVWSTGATGNQEYVLAPGNYTVSATNQCGTVVSSPVNVTLLPLPVASISGDTQLCEGESTILTASGGDNYLWSTGAINAAISVSTAGSYTVTASNACGNDQVAVVVSVSSISAAFSYEQGSGVPSVVDFTNESSSSAVSFFWDFGNGETSASTNPSTIFNDPGTYEVVLTAVNALGCAATYTEWITVDALPSALEVPNVFTPNNDFINDFFLVNANNIREFNMLILNRWGNVITTLQDVQQGWDGTINGDQAPDGTYYYQIDATGLDDQAYHLSGFFQLVR